MMHYCMGDPWHKQCTRSLHNPPLVFPLLSLSLSGALALRNLFFVTDKHWFVVTSARMEDAGFGFEAGRAVCCETEQCVFNGLLSTIVE